MVSNGHSRSVHGLNYHSDSAAAATEDLLHSVVQYFKSCFLFCLYEIYTLPRFFRSSQQFVVM